MSWKIIRHIDSNILETCYEGFVSPTELDEAFSATIETGLESSSRLYLGDLAKLEGGHSMADLYVKAQLLESIEFPSDVRQALVSPINPSVKPFVEFWELICRNRGFDFRTFGTREEALDWLKLKS